MPTFLSLRQNQPKIRIFQIPRLPLPPVSMRQNAPIFFVATNPKRINFRIKGGYPGISLFRNFFGISYIPKFLRKPMYRFLNIPYPVILEKTYVPVFFGIFHQIFQIICTVFISGYPKYQNVRKTICTVFFGIL